MRVTMSNLWRDDAGFVVSTELVLVATILVLGILVGQSTLRDAVISELADTADAIQTTNQSYSFSAVTGHSSSIAGTSFLDLIDFCENEVFGINNRGQQGTGNGFGMCVNISVTPSDNG